MEQKVVLEKEWIMKYKELKLEIALIEEEIREIEDYSILLLDEIVSSDSEIDKLKTEIQQINNLPKELKNIKQLMIEGTIISLLAACSLSMFFTTNLDELTKENLMRIFSKFAIFLPIFESLIMIPSIKEYLLIKNKIKCSDEKISKINDKIEEKEKSQEKYSKMRKSDLEIIESLDLEKKKIVLEISELIKSKYPEVTLNQEKEFLHNNFVKFLEANVNEYDINEEKMLLKKINVHKK